MRMILDKVFWNLLCKFAQGPRQKTPCCQTQPLLICMFPHSSFSPLLLLSLLCIPFLFLMCYTSFGRACSSLKSYNLSNGIPGEQFYVKTDQRLEDSVHIFPKGLSFKG